MQPSSGVKSMSGFTLRRAYRAFVAVWLPLLIANAGAGNTESPSIDIDNFVFSPSRLTINMGQAITWTNHDDEPHTVAFDNEPTRSPPLDKDEKYTRTFSVAGEYRYHCSLHPHMIGVVVVESRDASK